MPQEKSQATETRAGECTERSGVFYRPLDGIIRQRLAWRVCCMLHAWGSGMERGDGGQEAWQSKWIVDMAWAPSPGADGLHEGLSADWPAARAQPRPYRLLRCLQKPYVPSPGSIRVGFSLQCLSAPLVALEPVPRGPSPSFLDSTLQLLVLPCPPAATAVSPPPGARSCEPGAIPVIIVQRETSASERPLGSGSEAHPCALASSEHQFYCDDIGHIVPLPAAPLCGH
jgi:hypothetical protein